MEKKVYKSKYSLLFAILPIVVSSCVSNPTPYQPLDDNGGYKEEKQSNGSYKLLYVGNLQVDLTTVEKYWLRRANELCGNEGYTHEFTKTTELITHTEESGAFKVTKVMQLPSLTGNVICN